MIKEKRKLAEEIGDVQKKFEKTKQEYSKMFEDQKLLHHKAVELLRQELEKAKRSIDHLSKTKKLSKSEVHAELVMVREEKVVSNYTYDFILVYIYEHLYLYSLF